MKKSNNKAAAEAITVNRRRLLNNDAPFAMKEAYVKLRTKMCIRDRLKAGMMIETSGSDVSVACNGRSFSQRSFFSLTTALPTERRRSQRPLKNPIRCV